MAGYINRDEVLSMSYCTNKPTWDNPHLDPKSVVDVEDIESLPDSDVVEVVHGEWIRPTMINGRTFDIPHCSACGDVPCDTKNYCPNCGAKMSRNNVDITTGGNKLDG